MATPFLQLHSYAKANGQNAVIKIDREPFLQFHSYSKPILQAATIPKNFSGTPNRPGEIPSGDTPNQYVDPTRLVENLQTKWSTLEKEFVRQYLVEHPPLQPISNQYWRECARALNRELHTLRTGCSCRSFYKRCLSSKHSKELESLDESENMNDFESPIIQNRLLKSTACQTNISMPLTWDTVVNEKVDLCFADKEKSAISALQSSDERQKMSNNVVIQNDRKPFLQFHSYSKSTHKNAVIKKERKPFLQFHSYSKPTEQEAPTPEEFSDTLKGPVGTLSCGTPNQNEESQIALVNNLQTKWSTLEKEFVRQYLVDHPPPQPISNQYWRECARALNRELHTLRTSCACRALYNRALSSTHSKEIEGKNESENMKELESPLHQNKLLESLACQTNISMPLTCSLS